MAENDGCLNPATRRRGNCGVSNGNIYSTSTCVVHVKAHCGSRRSESEPTRQFAKSFLVFSAFNHSQDFRGINREMKFVFLLTVCLGIASGLYEDQIGKFDWHQKYFGPIRFILNDVNQPKRIIVGTENNIVGALNSNTGEILYRNILEASGKLLYIGNYIDRSILSISKDEKQKLTKLRAFAAVSGIERRQWILQDFQFEQAVESDSNVYLIKSEAEQRIVIKQFQLNDESIVERKTHSVQLKHQANLCKVALPYLVCLSNIKKELSLIGLATGTMATKTLDVGDDTIEDFDVTGSKELTALLLKGKTSAHLFQIQPNGDLTKIAYKTPPAVISIKLTQSKSEDGNALLFVTTLSYANSIRTDIFTLTENKLAQANGQHFEVNTEQRGISSLELIKVYILNQNYGLTGLTKDELLFGSKLSSKSVDWTREESLGNIIEVEMIDYPTSLQSASDSDETVKTYEDMKKMNIITSFITRIKCELESLFNIESYNSDSFGLRKIIIYVTAVGKVVGMDNTNGMILYTFQLPKFSVFRNGKINLFIQRRIGKYSSLKPIASIIYRNQINNSTILFPFNPIEGHASELQVYPEILTNTMLTHYGHNIETKFIKPILLLDSSFNIHVYPKNGLEIDSKMYLFLANGTILNGYGIQQTGQAFKANKLWSFNVGSNSAELLGIYGKSPTEKIHSQGRVLPDRSVSYKYMNPNLIVVVTGEEDNINLFLVDAVSGSIIHSFWHKKSRGPVHVVHSEHWIIYSLFNEKYRRFEMNSIELYEGLKQANATVFSSFSPVQSPIIVKQSYIFPSAIQTMDYTRTEKGITNKDILIGLPNGGVLQLPRIILQPKLSQQSYLTQVQDEDGNFHHMPYIPELPTPSDMVINYNQTIKRINGIKTWPTKLESTCLVLAYGSDIFYTKVSPSKTFDVLNDDFDHLFITVVLGALCIGAYLTKRFSAKKQLEQAWR